jgi:acetyl esterase/lipase
MRPRDARYAALPLPEAPGVDATLDFVVIGWPVIDPLARYEFAKAKGNEGLVKNHDNYWITTDAMLEGNPTRILERGEKVELPPLLVVQGTADASIPWEIPDRFAQQWRDAGGDGHCERFEGQPHGFMYEPGEARERGLRTVREFIARRLKAAVPA